MPASNITMLATSSNGQAVQGTYFPRQKNIILTWITPLEPTGECSGDTHWHKASPISFRFAHHHGCTLSHNQAHSGLHTSTTMAPPQQM
jgi:hypothetical protein